ncbi:MAG: peptidase domain-containing ABC transporter [Prevotella sp.]|nr:peptidase domain-containing ABC transporter [Prevotellaceae bacterium]MDY3935351.1 peptidase domain-containing ABC transporter [Prevotella sp.]
MRKIKSFIQLEQSDCGITCLRIIANFYGKNIPLSYLRDLCDISRIGVTVKDIIDCASKIGLKSLGVKIPLDKLNKMPLPAILHWNQNHFVVLYKVTAQKVYIVDPSIGKVALSHSDFQKNWMQKSDKGIAIVLEPIHIFYSTEYPKEKKASNLYSISCFSISKFKKNFLFVILFSIFGIITDMISPILFQKTIDYGIGEKNINLVLLLIMGQFAFFVGNYLSNNLVSLILMKTGLRIGTNLINDYLKQLISLPMAFFDRKANSDFIQKIDDYNRIKNFLLDIPDTFFITIVSSIVFSVLLIYYDKYIFLLFLVTTMISIFWTLLFTKKRRSLDYTYYACASENRNNIYELIYGMTDIKINNAENIRVKSWKKIQETINKLSFNSALINLYIRSGNVFIERIKHLVITGVCASYVIDGEMTIGIMMTINYIAGRLSIPLSDIIESINAIQDASMSYERIKEINDYDIVKTDNSEENIPDGDLRINKVSFKYAGSFSPYVLKDISLAIPRGKVTAIVGESGCGKTTLIKLLLGFYQPQIGSISLGNKNLESFSKKEWLSNCSAVMQTGFIFNGTILENIALSASEPSIEIAKRAAKIACLDQFIEQLPMGYYTKIGVYGLELSGGQKQRLFIARAVYKQPNFLFLDEATSSLDANNESLIVKNFNHFFKGKSVIISAHRLSTIKNADQIVVLKNGTIVEVGKHSELIKQKGVYYTIVENQLTLENQLSSY